MQGSFHKGIFHKGSVMDLIPARQISATLRLSPELAPPRMAR
jgi:hypothetical protein